MLTSISELNNCLVKLYESNKVLNPFVMFNSNVIIMSYSTQIKCFLTYVDGLV